MDWPERLGPAAGRGAALDKRIGRQSGAINRGVGERDGAAVAPGVAMGTGPPPARSLSPRSGGDSQVDSNTNLLNSRKHFNPAAAYLG
ncbi:Hypothetical protein NTJ_02245 [Nesidiocoris tenuis]|uniref:Uncharacterized protein n=1 Tax=Nesidiocoris tenuis TaxID=355587 RepID=A0ABN7AGG7_9HEMI|nr:Hypothetical protein NTJ_02245 [Nesidiocoris tenuis]